MRGSKSDQKLLLIIGELWVFKTKSPHTNGNSYGLSESMGHIRVDCLWKHKGKLSYSPPTAKGPGFRTVSHFTLTAATCGFAPLTLILWAVYPRALKNNFIAHQHKLQETNSGCEAREDVPFQRLSRLS